MTAANRYSCFFPGLALMIVFAIAVMGCGENNDSDEPVTSIGEPPEQDIPQTPAASIDDGAIDRMLTIEGEILKQCPAGGCWFIVKDESGEVFVDLNPAGLRLRQKREGQHAKVTGRVAKSGGQYRLEAQHVQFETKNETAPEKQE